MKTESLCTRCRRTKPISEFYADQKSVANGGVQYYCKACVKLIRREHYDVHAERIMQRVIEYKNAHPEIARAHSKKQRAAQSLEEKHAWAKLNREVNAGRVVRPAACERCGEARKLFAHHHNGYSADHATDVVWVCVPCHHALHGRGPRSRV